MCENPPAETLLYWTVNRSYSYLTAEETPRAGKGSSSQPSEAQGSNGQPDADHLANGPTADHIHRPGRDALERKACEPTLGCNGPIRSSY